MRKVSLFYPYSSPVCVGDIVFFVFTFTKNNYLYDCLFVEQLKGRAGVLTEGSLWRLFRFVLVPYPTPNIQSLFCGQR